MEDLPLALVTLQHGCKATLTFRHHIGCQTGLNPDELCWYNLDLTSYVNDWWDDNKDDCDSYDGFANCWCV